MKDSRDFCIRSALEMLVEVRGFQFKTLLPEQTNYVCGYLAGLMYADIIDRDEFARLCKLAANAQFHRAAELRDRPAQGLAA